MTPLPVRWPMGETGGTESKKVLVLLSKKKDQPNKVYRTRFLKNLKDEQF